MNPGRGEQSSNRPSPIRIGFAGCGEVGLGKHLPALAEVDGLQVAAIADIDKRRRELAHRDFGVSRTYDAVDALLADDSLDAIAVCLPPPLQAQTAIAALEAGKHVWIDPPVALCVEDHDRVVDTAARHHTVLLTGFHMRWHRLVRQARSIVRGGELGVIQTVRATWNSPRRDNHLSEWRKFRHSGGGALVEVAIDHFDLWRFVLGAEVTQIYAQTVDGAWEDESAVLSAKLSNGVLASAVFSERTSHDIVLEISGKDARLRLDLLRFDGLEVVPTEVMSSRARARMGRLAHLLRELPKALPRMKRAGDYRLSYIREWTHFVDCVHGRDQPQSTLMDAREAMLVSLAALESASCGAPVQVHQSALP